MVEVIRIGISTMTNAQNTPSLLVPQQRINLPPIFKKAGAI